jgi:acyl carrier protein
MESLETAKDVLAKALFIHKDRIADDAAISDIKPLDSLSFEALILELEERTGKVVDPVDLIGISTIRDLAGVIEKLS